MSETAAHSTLDTDALARWLAGMLPGFEGPVRLEKFKGGQSNPTFALESPSHRLVLRSKPGPVSQLLPSAHAIEREYRVLAALAGTDVPVPRVHALCEDESVLGRMFYIMERVEGRIFWNSALPELDPAERGAIYAAMNRTVSALHRVDPESVGLADYGASGNYFARQIGRWTKQYRAAETGTIEAMERLIEWLPTRIPDDDATRIVHGDFRIDNLVFHPDEPRVIAVLDWELSTLGHPLADFAYHCLAWFTPPGIMRGLAGLDIEALGIPRLSGYIADYCRATGRDGGIPDMPFYLAYNLFRLAGIAQGIARRAEQGTASSAQAVETGKLARPVAELGWKLAQG
ncbi:phosphotransferase [Pseudomarimonas salicorniae]|uniref:Phosphotransferase n=1 Tax=Pseudomarimonas salicorniae TaxID=2933270 RepID=A0ABT0GGR1_9GAMM|nr:phosphotransferase [Lysobacter sp. CAU 1642]MCK7593205.1 phosphotransferase [Lysobacter sp. CAU 1642]